MKYSDGGQESEHEVTSKQTTFLQILEPEPELTDFQVAQQLTNMAPDPCPCRCKSLIYTDM